MQIRILIVLVFTCCLACHNKSEEKADSAKTEMEFDKTKWRIKKDLDYTYRDKMYKELRANAKLKGLTQEAVLDLLGEPDRSDSGYLFYTIAQQRIGSFPLHTKTLVINIPKDSTVAWARIHE
jgi:hypothetical protein